MSDNTRIEQRGCFEGVLIEKIRADQTALRRVELRVRFERILHLIRPRFENIQQISVSAIEIVKNIA